MITLRVQVTIPFKGKRPRRVRVVLKDRDAFFFPFRCKLVSIPLYKAMWRLQPDNVWLNEQAMAVPLHVPKLLDMKGLALQLYCLRGSSVQHKGIFNFRRVMEQREDDELVLAMRYPKCDRKGRKEVTRTGSVDKSVAGNTIVTPVGKEEGVKQVTRAGSMDKSVAGNTIITPAVVEHSTLSPATDSLGNTSEVHASGSEPSLATSARQQDVHVHDSVSVSEHVGPPRRFRFSDSGAVFPELVREYEEVKAKEEADNKAKKKDRLALTPTCEGTDSTRVYHVLCGVLGVGVMVGGLVCVAVMSIGALMSQEYVQHMDWM